MNFQYRSKIHSKINFNLPFSHFQLKYSFVKGREKYASMQYFLSYVLYVRVHLDNRKINEKDKQKCQN